MPRTFCNDALVVQGRHVIYTERGVYIMSGSWIDTTAPCDMMDYGLTLEWREIYEAIRLKRRAFNLTHIRLHGSSSSIRLV